MSDSNCRTIAPDVERQSAIPDFEVIELYGLISGAGPGAEPRRTIFHLRQESF